MSDAVVINIATQAIFLVLICSGPILLTAMVVGFVIALLQTITSIQEQTLTFVPKTLLVFGVIIALGPWLLSTMVGYLTNLWLGIPDMLGR
ncbi:Flagellar biosynthetic protein FliQ [compost metagenome]|jgi:Flagellar biosynthesis pathway, component FliQ